MKLSATRLVIFRLTLIIMCIALISPHVVAQTVHIDEPGWGGRFIDPCPNSYRFTGDSWCSPRAKALVGEFACRQLGYSGFETFNVFEGANQYFSNWKLIERYRDGAPFTEWRGHDGRGRIGMLVCRR
jgi:hypothetical protein